MRCKADGHRLSCRQRKLFLNLRRVAVNADTVGLDALIDLAVQVIDLGPAPRAGGSRLCVDNHRIRIDQSLLHQRIDRQEGAGGITARIGNQAGIFDLISVDFRKSVYRFLHIFRRLMFYIIPFLIHRHILDPVVGA